MVTYAADSFQPKPSFTAFDLLWIGGLHVSILLVVFYIAGTDCLSAYNLSLGLAQACHITGLDKCFTGLP